MIIDQERRRASGSDWNPSPSACGPAQRGAATDSSVQAASNRSHALNWKKHEKHQGPRLGTLPLARLRPRWEPIFGTSETSLKEAK